MTFGTTSWRDAVRLWLILDVHRCLLIYVTDPGRWRDAWCSVKMKSSWRTHHRNPPCTPTPVHAFKPTLISKLFTYTHSCNQPRSEHRGNSNKHWERKFKGRCRRDLVVFTPRLTSWTRLSDIICSNLQASSTGGCLYLLSGRCSVSAFFLFLALHSFSKIKSVVGSSFTQIVSLKRRPVHLLGWTGL